MHAAHDRTRDVPIQIKNPNLVEQRQRQIVDASVKRNVLMYGQLRIPAGQMVIRIKEGV